MELQRHIRRQGEFERSHETVYGKTVKIVRARRNTGRSLHPSKTIPQHARQPDSAETWVLGRDTMRGRAILSMRLK